MLFSAFKQRWFKTKLENVWRHILVKNSKNLESVEHLQITEKSAGKDLNAGVVALICPDKCDSESKCCLFWRVNVNGKAFTVTGNI